MHMKSGDWSELIHRSIEIGIAKFNVNTELRSAYIGTLREQLSASKAPELVDLMNSAIKAMQAVVQQKLQLFRSSGKFAW